MGKSHKFTISKPAHCFLLLLISFFGSTELMYFFRNWKKQGNNKTSQDQFYFPALKSFEVETSCVSNFRPGVKQITWSTWRQRSSPGLSHLSDPKGQNWRPQPVRGKICGHMTAKAVLTMLSGGLDDWTCVCLDARIRPDFTGNPISSSGKHKEVRAWPLGTSQQNPYCSLIIELRSLNLHWCKVDILQFWWNLSELLWRQSVKPLSVN